VISERGRRQKSGVVETNGRSLVEFLKTVPGRTHLCLEQGRQSGWLYEVLSPHVDEIVVTRLEQPSRSVRPRVPGGRAPFWNGLEHR
jgi:hypothetical protein